MMNWSKYIDRLKRKKQAERIKQMVKDAMATWPKWKRDCPMGFAQGGPVKRTVGGRIKKAPDVSDVGNEFILPQRRTFNRQYIEPKAGKDVEAIIKRSTGPVVIWVNKRSQQMQLHGWLHSAGLKPVTMMGETSAVSIQNVLAKFQRGELPVLLLSLGAYHSGIRLDAAETMILLDIPKEHRLAEQAVMRAWGVTRKKPLDVYYLSKVKVGKPCYHASDCQPKPWENDCKCGLLKREREARLYPHQIVMMQTLFGKPITGRPKPQPTDLETAIRRLREYKHIMAMGDVGRLLWDGLPEFFADRWGKENLPDWLIRKARAAMGDKLAELKCKGCDWHGFETKHMPYLDAKFQDYVVCPICGTPEAL